MCSVIDNPAKIQAFQVLQWKYAIKLEKVGLKHSSGRSVAAHVKKIFGLPRSTSHDTLIQILSDQLKGLNQCVSNQR